MLRNPTSEHDLARLDDLLNFIAPSLGNLWARWQDEKEYESIDDYGQVIAKQLPLGMKFVAMTARPFGFKFTIGTEAVYYITATSRSMQWKRIK